MRKFKHTFGSVFGHANSIPVTKPTISNVIVGSITDVAFDIECEINSHFSNTTVFIHYGLSPSLGTSVEMKDSPVIRTEKNGVVSAAISGLLPYKRYYYSIVATNSRGFSYLDGHIETLMPLELNDGNWVGMYDPAYAKNQFTPSFPTQLSEFRDTQYDCAIGNDLFTNTTFDTNTGWTPAAEMEISGGKLKFVSSTANRSAYTPIVGGININPCQIDITDVVVTEGIARVRVSGAANKISGGGDVPPLVNGNISYEGVFTNNTPYVYVYNSSPFPTTIEIGGIRIREIRGKHFINLDVSSTRPTIANGSDYVNFTSPQRIVGYSIPNLGTVYADVKRVGIDSDFNLSNDLANVGEYNSTSDTLTLGANSTLTVFYPIQLRKLALRSVTDSNETIIKLNEWFSRESYEIPPLPTGVLSSGIYNDNEIWNDNDIPVTILI